MEPCRLGEQLRTQADLLSEPAFERTLAPPDGPGEITYRNEAAMLEDFANRANGAGMGSSSRGYPLEEKPLEQSQGFFGSVHVEELLHDLPAGTTPQSLERDAGVRYLCQIHAQNGKRPLRSETDPRRPPGARRLQPEGPGHMPDHASARLNRMAGDYLPQNAVAETKYEIDASIGEDPVPFVAMRRPLEQPNALDEFLESRHRLAFTQLHVFVSSSSPMADRIVNPRLTVLDESDAEDGLAQTASRDILAIQLLIPRIAAQDGGDWD
jgi:hypothetical protein